MVDQVLLESRQDGQPSSGDQEPDQAKGESCVPYPAQVQGSMCAIKCHSLRLAVETGDGIAELLLQDLQMQLLQDLSICAV